MKIYEPFSHDKQNKPFARVVERDGLYFLTDGESDLAGPFTTNAEAWKAADSIIYSDVDAAHSRVKNAISNW